jgi:hypothetical protein
MASPDSAVSVSAGRVSVTHATATARCFGTR